MQIGCRIGVFRRQSVKGEPVEFGILGPLVVSRDGRKVEVGATKPRALLALLVLRREQVVTTETLVDEIWGDHPPVTATKVIHGYVYQLRKALGDGVLETERGGYRLRVTADEVDVGRFESLIRRGRVALDTGDPRYATAMIREALELWRGPPLAEFGSSNFAAAERDRLLELRLVALACRVDADLALGNHTTAVPELQALVIEHPFRETLRGQLMLTLYRAGRQADALARLSRCANPAHRGAGYRAGRGSAAFARRDPRPRSGARPAGADPRCRRGHGTPTGSPARPSSIPHRAGTGRSAASLRKAS